ncbi:nuclear pore complex protein Nup54 [Cimex lectularius]|uniref:Nucleoporin Nup54 n=1 Tax=Cimex lectularius TaxID=79782 RepID=A0A8I6RMG8_CIMLE|nr:nuclear pore complex protein Nup54 [Cimex lectularius]
MTLNFGSTPAFGVAPSTGATGFGFGTQAATTKPAEFGSNLTFGAPATTSTPSFGLGSNAQTTASTGFGFGTGFGTTATSQPTAFSGFGSSATTTTTFSGFGAPAPTTSSFFGFGSYPSTTTSAPSLFSGFGQQNTLSSFGLKPFGQTQSTFGLGSSLGQGLGQQQQQQLQQQQQQQQQSGVEQVTNSVFNCAMFGDEHDKTLSKLNFLQACWGTGKGYYNTNIPPVEYTSTNPFYKFKSIAYSSKPSVDAKDGLVALQFNKKEEDIRKQQDALKSSLSAVLGNKPNLAVNVDNIRPVSDNSAIVFIYVEEKFPNGQTKRISNTNLTNYLMQMTQKSQLENMGVCRAYPINSPDEEQIKEYLSVPPPGVDPVIWKTAQANNPDPKNLIPVPIMGYGEVKWRYHCQVEQTKRHQAFIDKIAEEILNLKSENESSRLKLLEFKQKIVEIDHRILKLMVKQQATRNIGVALQPEEEVMRSRLDSVQNQLNAPQFSGRLNELLTQVRLHKQEATQENLDAYKMTDTMQQEIKQFLLMQQEGIKSLIEIMQSDMADLKAIEQQLKKK